MNALSLIPIAETGNDLAVFRPIDHGIARHWLLAARNPMTEGHCRFTRSGDGRVEVSVPSLGNADINVGVSPARDDISQERS